MAAMLRVVSVLRLRMKGSRLGVVEQRRIGERSRLEGKGCEE
jgi:hypothetical protein